MIYCVIEHFISPYSFQFLDYVYDYVLRYLKQLNTNIGGNIDKILIDNNINSV